MWWWDRKRRLLALCGIIIPFCLVYFLKFSVLSVLLLLFILGTSIFVLKISSNGAQRNIPNRSWVKGHESQSGGPVKKRLISPVFPMKSQRSPSALKEREYVQKSGYNGHDHRLIMKSKHPMLSSPNSSTEFAPSQIFSQQRSAVVASDSGFVSPFSNYNKDAGLVRKPLFCVRAPSISPLKNSVNSSPLHFKPITRNQLQSDYGKATGLPLSNRHYPTHQPDYTRTSMGILPASSIFYGDRTAVSLSPLRKGGGGVRMHSPVTVKIARPDIRRSASPLFRRVSLESSSGSPLHKDTVIAALNERRKRVAVDEQDDSSSVASSAAGGVLAKRRRLDDSSQCSTPSLASSSNYSTMVNGDAVSESSADESARVRFRATWMGARGVQSRTPRNAIDSSISSSRRATLANQMMLKRMLLQPATPENSPPKKALIHPDDSQTASPGKTPQSITLRTTAGSDVENSMGGSDSEGRDVSSKDRSSSSEDGTPTRNAGTNLLGPRLRTPKLKMVGHQMLRNCSPPGEYTAADLEEDRHLVKQRVNYILDSLKDDEEKEINENKSKDQQPPTSGSLVAPQIPLVSAETPSTADTPSTSKLHQLSKMNTLPLLEIQKGQLLLPSAKSDAGAGAKDKQALTKDTSSPATKTQPTGPAPAKGALGVTFKTPVATEFLPSSGATIAINSSALGFTVMDATKPGASVASLEQPAGIQPSKSAAAEKDPLLKSILAAPGPAPAATSAGLGLGGAPLNANPSLTLGKLGGTYEAGLGQAPNKSLTGLLSQGTPVGGFSLASGVAQPQTSQRGAVQFSAAVGLQQGSTTSSSLFSQALGGSGLGLMTATSSGVTAAKAVSAAGSGFQFGAPATKPASIFATSGSEFRSSAQGATSTVQSTLQFGVPTQTSLNNASAGFQMPSKTTAAVSTATASGIVAVKTEAQENSPFLFGGSLAKTAETTAPALSFGGASVGVGGQAGPTSLGLFNPTTAASSSIFGSANTAAATAPNFTPAFGQAVSTTPAQPATPALNFSSQPQSTAGSTTTGGFQFKPAFGAPPQTQPSQSQLQPGKPTFQFGGTTSSQPAASSGGFTFNAAPATTGSSGFAAGAAAFPFQAGASSTPGGIFGQQPTSQPPSFGAATAQPTNAFGGPAPTPAQSSMFGSQSTTQALSPGGFNFGAPVAQTNPPPLSFGGQQANQPASGSGMFQFGQQAGSGQQVSQSMGGFGTPNKPTPFNFGGADASGGFGTPAPTAAPSFVGVTPTNPGGFSLGSMGSTSTQKRTSRMRQARQARRR